MGLADACAAALEVLSESIGWLLPRPRWERVTEIVQLMDNAMSTGDPVALDNATVELERAGPVRITRIGATRQVPPPPKVLERLTRTAGRLAAGAAGGPIGPAQPRR